MAPPPKARAAGKSAAAALQPAALAPGLEGKTHVVAPPPTAAPSFDVKAVRSAIPAELFERSMFWSFFHLGVDLVKVAAMAAAMWALDASALPLAAKAVAWPALWYLQGAFMTGIWVLAHECGHQAFSASKTVNDAVGLVLVSSRSSGVHAHGQTRGCAPGARRARASWAWCRAMAERREGRRGGGGWGAGDGRHPPPTHHTTEGHAPGARAPH